MIITRSITEVMKVNLINPIRLTIVIRVAVHMLASTLLLISSQSFAQYLTHQVNANSVTITADGRTLTLTALTNNSFAALYDSKHHTSLPSYAIDEANLPTNISLNVNEQENQITIDTGKNGIKAVVDKRSMKVSYYANDQLLLAEDKLLDQVDELGFSFSITDSEQLLGTGERVLGMNRRGHKLPLYNKAHYGYTTESSQMYYGLSAIFSSKKYILLFDNSAKGEVDVAATDSTKLKFSAVTGRLSYIVIAGSSYPELIHHYVDVTGKQPMPPRWALGNFASRFGYRNQQEVYDVTQKFIDDDIPLDVLVLDLYWFGKDIKGHMGNLAWDNNAFPTPTKMIAELQEQGVNTVVITEPFVLSSSNNWQSASDANALTTNQEGKPYQFDFYFGNTGLIDVFNQQGQQWFAQAYQSLHQQGVTGWWGDLGEPEVHPDDSIHQLDTGEQVSGAAVHNAYGHKWAEMVFNETLKLTPNKRPMIMMRSGFAGSQRYGMIPWTGDVSRSWGGLKPQVELSLQMSLLGLAYTHSDLGGFAGGEAFDAELYTRWLQFGVFQPIYRPHAQEHIAPEPIFHDEKTKAIVRDFIKLRYRMLPYNYTLAFENSQTGMPLMRPMFFENEQDLSLIDNTQSYFWGDAFLVTPIVEPSIKSVEIALPKGQWLDFWTGKIYLGEQTINYPVELNTIPVLVRAGAFVPMLANDIVNTREYSGQALELHYYADQSVKSAQGQFYDDDGISFNAVDNKRYYLYQFSAQNSAQELAIKVRKKHSGLAKERIMNLVVNNWHKKPNKVLYQGKTIPILASKRALLLASKGAFWEKSQSCLTIKANIALDSQTEVIVR